MSNNFEEENFEITQEAFREAMSRLASPLTVITARDQENKLRGFTATSVTSMSLEPPLICFGVSHTSSCFNAMTDAEEFTVNILGVGQNELASKFAESGVDRFIGVRTEYWKRTGTPYLADAPTVIHCSAAGRATFGDHDLLIGRCSGVQVNGERKPLIWYRRAFRTTD